MEQEDGGARLRTRRKRTRLALGMELFGQSSCAGYCSVAVINHPNQKQLTADGEFLLAYGFRGVSRYGGGAERGQPATGLATGREAKGSRLEPQAQSSENKLEMAQVF